MKKFNKYIISIAALAVVAASGLYSVQASGLSYSVGNEAAISTEIKGIEDAAIAEYEARAAIQYEATQAFAALCDTFGVTEGGATIYPDDYAGAWIDGATLYVALTSLDVSVTDKYDRIFNGFDCVEYEEAEYSLNELQEIKDSVFEELSENYEITAYYTQVDTNKIVFEVASDLVAVENELADVMNAPQAFLADLDNAVPISADLFVIKQGEPIQTQATLRGGMEIHCGDVSGAGYSIGMCGTVKIGPTTYEGIVTAGHGMANYGTQRDIYRAGSKFGETELVLFHNNCSGDWALVRKTNSDTLSNLVYGSSSSYSRDITGTRDDLAKGTYVMKYGYNGGYCTCTVEEQDVAMSFGAYTINGLTRCSLGTGTSLGGDSGGPYYIHNSGYNHDFVGIHCGISGSGSNTKLYFTPYIRFKDFFIPKTS